MQFPVSLRYIGVNDTEIDLFEGQYTVPSGMSYNSYLLLDDKIAVMDTVDARFGTQWLDNLAQALDGRTPDYLIVHHMEPDHSANISRFMQQYPSAQIVATAKAFAMMKLFYGTDYAERQVVATEGSTLPLGTHTLTFLTAPMVHWPEVMVSYDAADRVLFSADAFGKFGAHDSDEPWEAEARRYYIGIVGKYGVPVQTLLKKATALAIDYICPLHGPVLHTPLDEYLRLYSLWASYAPEKTGTLIAYTSVYGHTKEAATLLADALQQTGSAPVETVDLCRCDMAQAVALAFCYDTVVFATTTYNADIFPPMRAFIEHLTARGFQNRRVALLENGSWAPAAKKVMHALLDGCKELTFLAPEVTLRASIDDESRAQLAALAAAIDAR